MRMARMGARGRLAGPVARVVVPATLALLALLAGPVPAAAADDEVRGWFAALDLALTQPNSLDQSFADVTDISGVAPRSRRLTIDNDDDATFRGTVGYSLGGDLGRLQVSYWSFDNDDKERGSLIGTVTPTIFGSGYFGYMILTDPAVQVRSSVKATTTDLDYTRDLDLGERSTVRWLAGLRVATFEEDRSFVGVEGGYAYTQRKHIESDGVGFRVGATGIVGFTEQLSLQGGATFSFLQADREGRAVQSPSPTVCLAPEICPEVNRGEDDNVRGEMRDFDLRVVWESGPLAVHFGYAVSSWEGMVRDPVPGRGFLFQGEGPNRDAISFNSFHTGITWRFGPGHGIGPP